MREGPLRGHLSYMKMITEALAKALNELGSCHGDGVIWDSHSHENPTRDDLRRAPWSGHGNY